MNTKKYVYRTVISAVLLLFLTGTGKVITETEKQAVSSANSAGQGNGAGTEQEHGRMLPDDRGEQKEMQADSDGSGEQKGTHADSGGQKGAEAGSGEETREKKKIALTFDDGPDSEYTPMLLDGLAERGVKATFFVIGKQAEEQPEVMKRIVDEGHLIGNHTYNHVDIRHMTQTAAKEEILKANEVIIKYTGEEPCFLRPPFGNGTSRLEKDVEMIQVLWTIDTMDWACKNEAQICSTVYREVKDNSIILMHDEYPTTVRAALRVIDKLQKEGYEFVTVDKIVMD